VRELVRGAECVNTYNNGTANRAGHQLLPAKEKKAQST